MKKPSVSVVIVNWNGGELLNVCLEHLLRQSSVPDRILVMDNGSVDGSAEKAARFPGVTVVFLKANLGFAAANNRALAFCDTELVVLLNPDAFVQADWLEKLLKAAILYPEVAAFGSRQMIDGVDHLIDGIGDCYHISGLVWRNRYGKFQSALDSVSCEIFAPCAAAALYRRQALVDVGGFDEDYFCYVEDVDLGFRLRLMGHKAMYVADAVVYHVGSAATGGRHSDFSVYHGHRNLVWAFVKNMPGWLFWVLLPLHVALNIATVGYFGLKGRWRIVCRAKFDALMGLTRMWQKRRSIQKNRIASLSDIWRALDKQPIMSFRYSKRP